MKRAVLTILLMLLISPAAQAQNVVFPFEKYSVLHAADLQALEQAVVSVQGGASNQQTLTNAIVGAASVNMNSAPTVVTCPVGSCPAIGNPQLAYSAFQQYGVTSLSLNWELGAVIGLLDNTGGGTGGANDHTNGAKMGLYVGLMQTPTGGPGWALNTNIIRCATPGGPNSIGSYAGAGNACTNGQSVDAYSSTIGYELDVSNFDRDADGLPPSSPFVVGEYLTTTSTYSGWAGVFYGIGQGQSANSWHDGIWFTAPNSAGGRVVSDNTIFDASNADVGYHSQGTHATTSWYDEAAGQFGIWITGTKSIEDEDLTTNTPVGIGINGTRAFAAIHLNESPPSGASNSGIVDTGSHGQGQSYDDQSTSDVGIKAEGTYAYAAFSAQQSKTKLAFVAAENQEVCFNNSNNCVEWDGNTLVYSIGGTRMFAIDNSGNLSIKGSLTQNGTP